MAVDRLSNFAAGPAQPQTQPSRHVRQAQAAFFQAALGKTEGAAPPAPSPIAPAQQTAPAPSGAAPRPGYRPGSLLDIKI